MTERSTVTVASLRPTDGRHGRPAPLGDHRGNHPHDAQRVDASGTGRRSLLVDVLAAWVAARVVVGGGLALVHRVATEEATGAAGRQLRTTGLLGWDAAYYRDIAERGYAGVGRSALRFFPLVPLLVRWLGVGGHAGVVLLVLVNIAALCYGAAFVRLARMEGIGAATTSRAVWLLALAPPAFVLVMGYAEAVFGLLAVGVFLGARTRRWELATAAGVLAGLCRPVGVLMAAPVAVEALRGIGRAGALERARRAVAVLAPAAGAAAYLLWVRAVYGDLWLPLRLQRDPTLHGASANPFRVVWDAARGTLHGHLGTGLHVPWLLVCVGLGVVMAHRLPASYTVWSALTLAVVLSGSNLDSLERYALGAFPIALVAAQLLRRTIAWQLAIVASTMLLGVYAALAFFLFYVP